MRSHNWDSPRNSHFDVPKLMLAQGNGTYREFFLVPTTSLGTANQNAELRLGVPRKKRLQPWTVRYKLLAGLGPGRLGGTLTTKNEEPGALNSQDHELGAVNDYRKFLIKRQQP